jgi:hypothetical protein
VSELTCQHGVGHSGGIHGCDGCCAVIAKAVEEHIIKLLRTELGPYLIWVDDTPYIKGIDLDGFIALIKGDATSKDSFTVGLEGENK